MKQSIKDWAFQKRDWILSEQIDQTELLTEEEYKEAMDRWKQMGVAENYKHQDGQYNRSCKPYFEFCRCQQ